MERLQKWKRVLNQASSLSGYHYNLGNEYEHDFIAKIVSDVSNKINRVPLYVADYPVGLQSRVLEVKSVLDMGSDSRVHMVGVLGIGECPLLGSLILNCCKYLREIKGIPPTLRCENESLTSSSRSMLLNKELHVPRSTEFSMAGTARVPEYWF
ncbi:TMV resistance protein N [Trifolium repens]|nr:TMV resistance protein N [Trifolium repens]